jgi:crossover junction endodeoxyribonuclease RuvC
LTDGLDGPPRHSLPHGNDHPILPRSENRQEVYQNARAVRKGDFRVKKRPAERRHVILIGMTILGLDTSLRSSGFGVLAVEGTRMRALEAGNIRNAPKLPLSACLRAIHARVSELIAQYRPDVMAIESVIYGKNAGTMLVLGEARGAVITAAANAALPVYEYEPRRVKKAVCGNGLAEKEQIQRMIKTLLHLDALPQNDAADALALAITHAHASSVLTPQTPL